MQISTFRELVPGTEECEGHFWTIRSERLGAAGDAELETYRCARCGRSLERTVHYRLPRHRIRRNGHGAPELPLAWPTLEDLIGRADVEFRLG